MNAIATVQQRAVNVEQINRKTRDPPVRGRNLFLQFRNHAGCGRSPSLSPGTRRPLSGRSLVWTINILVALAALLLVVLVFLSVTGEPPRWPLAMMGGAAVCVAGLYWGFFHLFAGASPGERLGRMVGSNSEEEEVGGARFR